MKTLRSILLTLLLAAAYTADGQGYVIDSVCRGAERHYRLDGDSGSTYSWSLTDPLGSIILLPETADTVTITWNMNAGEYTLSALQTSMSGCDSLELGSIHVFDLPLAYAGPGTTSCSNNPFTPLGATASGYYSLRWSSSGDGTFNDTTALHPVYLFGPADRMLGSVTLTLTATGFGRSGSCQPAESSVIITLGNETLPVFASLVTLCRNSIPPLLPATSLNGISGTWMPAAINTALTGISIFTFTPDSGQCAEPATLVATVTTETIPAFAPIGPLCLNSTAPALRDTSLNNITGTWIPSAVNTGTTGTSVYTFTPDSGQCALATTLTIMVSSPEIIEIQTSSSTNSNANGHVTIIAGGLATPLTYSLNGTNWQLLNSFTKLYAGTYFAWVRDANGCITSKQFTILNNMTGEVGVLAGDVLSCISLPIEIPVMAYDFAHISAFTIQMAFDSSILTFNGLSQINTILNNGNLTFSLVSPGILQIDFSASDSVTLLSEDLLFKLNFYGQAAGYTELQWNLLVSVVYSSFGYEIPSIYTRGAVEIIPVPQIFTAGGGDYCAGTPLVLSAGSLTGQALTYTWTSPDGASHTGPELDLGHLKLNTSGEYTVKAADNKNCAKTDTLELQVFPNPIIQLSEYDTLCAETELVLNPGPGFASYAWQDGSTQPQLVPTAEGMYWVIVTDSHGCQGSDTVTLRPCDLLIWIPNVFSPNGDGLNDQFLAKYNHKVEITFKMMVFNKWGQQLFSSDDIDKGWDGTFKGMPCPPDLYTWVVIYNAPVTYNFVQKSPQQGTVMLLK